MVPALETGPHATTDGRANGAGIGDPRSVVRKALEELAPCETGYPGVSWCRACGGARWCADIVEKDLKQRFPSVDWGPAIREVLGMW